MNIKRFFFFFLVVFLFLSISVSSQTNEKYLFKIAIEAPDGSSWVKAMRDISDKIKLKTNGEVGIVVYPGGIMGDQSTVLKKIKIGQLNGAAFSSLGLSYIYKDFTVFGFPMLYNDYNEYDYVVSKLSELIDREFEKGGFILLSWSEVGLIYLYSKNQVNSLDTLKKSKPLLIADDATSKYLFDQIGVRPIPLQMSDVMTGLQTGTIDTIFSSHYGVIAMQWVSKVNYVADFPITLMTGAVVVDSKLFNSMPVNYRKELKTLFKEEFDKLNQKVRKDNEDAIELLKRRGSIKVLPVSQGEREKFFEVCRDMAIRLTEKEYSRELYNKIVALVDEYRKNKR